MLGGRRGEGRKKIGIQYSERALKMWLGEEVGRLVEGGMRRRQESQRRKGRETREGPCPLLVKMKGNLTEQLIFKFVNHAQMVRPKSNLEMPSFEKEIQ